MSYCRFAWDGSDVYVFASRDGIECCGCRLKERSYTTENEEEMISHLAEHRRFGHYVPPHVIEALWSEIPGATKPQEPSPINLTKASLEMDIMRMQNRLEEIEKEIKLTPPEEAKQ